ncbi:hypothetical protein AJ80_08119 [Polytolypa hystricis UAMH7299]|uniref:argininosuccinate synthase n=1 Tax=Polytolypa hystricis (strain UAMH7299) TaxID=1447883 RepID=A0A2B7XD93_POLH7|nr:hypothetical protein AJ80_08119 [Polytolypa hystricis UAMH7299]
MAKEKVCLAYSGGLDTSVILAWLIEQGYDVVCFLADEGQVEDFKEAERKALAIGALKLVVADLKREFVDQLYFRAIQCNVPQFAMLLQDRNSCIGCIGIAENCFIDLKSVSFSIDSPAMTILRLAHIDLEGLTLDREVRALRDQFVTFTWSKLLYNGLYFSPERRYVETGILASQDDVNGQVRLRCYKGSVNVLGRRSETSKLYSPEQSSMDSLKDFQPTDTTGLIATQAIRLKAYGHAEAEAGIDLSKS